MPRGVPYRVQVLGKGSRTYTFTEIAAGTGLSLALVSLIFNRKRRITPYAATRLAIFFQITIEQLFTPDTITVETPSARPLGRIVGRVRPHSHYRLAVPNWDPVSELLKALDWHLSAPCPGGQPGEF